MSLRARTEKLGIKYFDEIYCAEHCVYIVVGTINCIFGGRVVVGSAFYEIFWWLCGFVIQYSNASYVVDFFFGVVFQVIVG